MSADRERAASPALCAGSRSANKCVSFFAGKPRAVRGELHCSSLWPQINETVGPCIRPGGLLLTRRALDVCRLPEGSRVADIGCGAGATLEHLESAGCRPVGLDCSDTLLGEAARRSVAGRLVGGRAEYLPFPDGSFDALFCECTLSILDDRSAALQECARVLKEGAFLIISDVFARNAAPQGQEVRSDALRTQGFLAKTGVMGDLTALGFSLLVWEEHDRLLKEFAARMVLAGQCLPDAWLRGQGQEKDKSGRKGISYFLLVARKLSTCTGAGAERKGAG